MRIIGWETFDKVDKILAVVRILLGLTVIALIVLQMLKVVPFAFYFFLPLATAFWVLTGYFNKKRIGRARGAYGIAGLFALFFLISIIPMSWFY